MSDKTDYEQTLNKVLDHHRAFWDLTKVDRPLLRTAPWHEYQPYDPFVLKDGTIIQDSMEIVPGLLDPIANLKQFRPTTPFDGDFLNGWGPYDVCWMESILGCRVFRAGPSTWSEPFVREWSDVDKFKWPGQSPWLDELLAITKMMNDEIKGQYPIGQPLLRGPLDMTEGSILTEILYVGFFTNPEELKKHLDTCTSVFIEVTKRRLAALKPFHGGYLTRHEWGLWAPGTMVQFQGDAMRNLSPETYRDYMFENDRRLCRDFEYSMIHTHSGCNHILPVLVEEPELKGIEVTLDPAPYGPPPISLLEKFQMIQAAGKSLLLSGPLLQSEYDTILEKLSPVGLAIRAGIIQE